MQVIYFRKWFQRAELGDRDSNGKKSSSLLNVVTAVERVPMRDSGPKFKGLDVTGTRILQLPPTPPGQIRVPGVIGQSLPTKTSQSFTLSSPVQSLDYLPPLPPFLCLSYKKLRKKTHRHGHLDSYDYPCLRLGFTVWVCPAPQTPMPSPHPFSAGTLQYSFLRPCFTFWNFLPPWSGLPCRLLWCLQAPAHPSNLFYV